MTTPTVLRTLVSATCVLATSIASGVDLRLLDDASTSQTNLAGTTSQATTNFGAGEAGFIRGGTYNHRTWLKFDHTALTAMGATWEQVTKATLRVYVKHHPQQSNTFVAGNVSVVSALGSWTETGLTQSNNPGVRTEVYDTEYVDTSMIDEFLDLDVTELVRDWLDGTVTNNGLVLYAPSGTTTFSINTKENLETSHHPQLIVELVGQAGTPGTQWLTGTGAPVSTAGVVGDFYLNKTSGEYYIKSSSGWGTPTSLKGTNGLNGAKWVNGAGAPNGSIGGDGDFYLDTVNSVYYGPKSGGAWSGTGFSLKGATGTPGTKWLSGTGAPGAVGADGDFYLDTESSVYYGPKAGGAWGAGKSLKGLPGSIGPKGDQGPVGPQGTPGSKWLAGAVAPAVELGVEGDFYLNTAAKEYYGPKTVAGWGTPTSLVGPQGLQGVAGPQGEQGPAGPAGPATLRVLPQGDLPMGQFQAAPTLP